MRRLLALVWLCGCGFGGADGDDGMMTAKARKLRFTIAAGKVSSTLTNFPVYVEVAIPELGTELDADAKLLSFREVNGTPLAYELQRFEPAAGKLQAWVRLPTVTPDGDTRFELLYGRQEIRVEPNPAMVWDGYYAVFHMETIPTPGVPSVPNSAVAAKQGTPAADLKDSDDVVAAKLGNGFDFDGTRMEQFTFDNPLSLGMPSTFSAWVNQRDTSDNDLILQIGSTAANNGRNLYSRNGNNEYVAADLNNDLSTTATNIEGKNWKLIHWSYETIGTPPSLLGQGRLFLDGINALPTNPVTYGAPADTPSGGLAYVGGASPSFGANAGANAQLDEVRIARTALSGAWMKAEFDNQSSPTTFLTIEGPQDTP